ILPFIEQQALFQLYRQDLFNSDPINRLNVGQQRMVPYECPSDPARFKLEAPASGPDTTNNWRHGSYRCVSGICGNVVSYGAWDTFEPQLWPNNTLDRGWRGVLHATSTAYNGVGPFATVDTSVPSVTTAQLGADRKSTRLNS